MNQSTPIVAFAVLLRRDLLMALRNRSDLANPPLFFILVISLFPLAVGPSPDILSRIAPGIIWVAALLATLLSLERLFRSDFEDGALEQIVLSHHPLVLFVFAKVAAHWLITGLPLLLIAPILGGFLHLSSAAMFGTLIALAIGTPILSLVGSIGVALTIGLNRGGMLLALLVLPLYTPVLIFGAGVIEAAGAALPINGYVAILAAMLAISLTLAPIASAAALRISLN